MEVFLVIDGMRHSFPNFDVFISNGFDMDDVLAVSFDVLFSIPISDVTVNDQEDKFKRRNDYMEPVLPAWNSTDVVTQC